jgi:hypothetical protein
MNVKSSQTCNSTLDVAEHLARENVRVVTAASKGQFLELEVSHLALGCEHAIWGVRRDLPPFFDRHRGLLGRDTGPRRVY